jgi:hypothetical protein
VWHPALDAPVRAGSARIGRLCCFDEGLYSASAHFIAPEGSLPRPQYGRHLQDRGQITAFERSVSQALANQLFTRPVFCRYDN